MKLIRTDWNRLLHEHLFMFGSTSEGCMCLFFPPWVLNRSSAALLRQLDTNPSLILKFLRKNYWKFCSFEGVCNFSGSKPPTWGSLHGLFWHIGGMKLWNHSVRSFFLFCWFKKMHKKKSGCQASLVSLATGRPLIGQPIGQLLHVDLQEMNVSVNLVSFQSQRLYHQYRKK